MTRFLGVSGLRYLAHRPNFAHMPTNDLTDLIGSKESAALLFIDRATLNRWAAKGRIPTAITAPGVTGPRLFRRADVEALAANLSRHAA